jgi:hypothetical protein
MMSRRLVRWLGPITIVVATAAALPAAALERGEFHDGLYTAPGKLFSVRSPFAGSPWVVDSFDRSAGAVTFIGDAGALYGVICTPSFDPLAGAQNDAETDLAILRNWLDNTTFPLFFARQLPGAELLREQPGSFEGAPAWMAVMYLPHGSALYHMDMDTGQPVRHDSYRGLVVFSRGDHTFLIMTEIAPDAQWNNFLPSLSNFYHGMAFAAPVPLPTDPSFAKVP